MKYIDTMFDLPVLLEKLRRAAIDLEVEYPNEHFDIVLVGGSALMLMDIKGKLTNDIDVFSVSDRKIIQILERHYMNTNVNAYSDNFSTDMETRYKLISKINCDNVRYFTCSLEDIVASKIAASREKDIQDISKEEVINRIDLELLDRIIFEELKVDYLIERRYRELVDNYASYREKIVYAQKKKS